MGSNHVVSIARNINCTSDTSIGSLSESSKLIISDRKAACSQDIVVTAIVMLNT